jgi:hypothetical protein
MDYTLRGGTDAGSMVIFDPAALPDDFDAKQQNNPVSQIEELMRAGRMFWLDTHADGAHSLGVYPGDRLPGRLRPYAKTLEACDPFHVPSGRLYFTGVEYAFRDDPALLRRYLHMGEAAQVPAGRYRAVFFEFDYPADFHEEILRQALPAGPYRLHQLMNALVPVGCLCVLGLLGSLFFLAWTVWLTVALPCGLVLVTLPIMLSRLPGYRQAHAVYKDIQEAFPDYGVVLDEIATA